jgi:hypothetical protein
LYDNNPLIFQVEAGEAPSHINQYPRIRDKSSSLDLKSTSPSLIAPRENNYLNVMSSYPVSINAVPGVALEPSPLISKSQFYTETPNLELSIAPFK